MALVKLGTGKILNLAEVRTISYAGGGSAAETLAATAGEWATIQANTLVVDASNVIGKDALRTISYDGTNVTAVFNYGAAGSSAYIVAVSAAAWTAMQAQAL